MDKGWAKGVLGLQESYSQEDLARSYQELKDIWSRHTESANPKVQAQGNEELEKIERAREILESPSQEEAAGLRPGTLVIAVAAVFLGSFGGMYLYRLTHKAPVSIMMPKSLLTSNQRVRLDVPDVTVSAQRMTAPPLTQDDRSQISDDIDQLSDDDASSAINDLESLGEKAIPALTDALLSRDDNRRMNAATAINEIAAGPDDAPNTAEDSARLRPIFQSAGTVDVLERLSNDPVDDTRQSVAYALGNIGDKSAFETLIRMSTDYEPAVRSGVAYSLGKLNDSDSIPTLSALLEDDDSSVRMSAANALGMYHNRESRTALQDRLQDESDSDVVTAIHVALGDAGQSDDSQGI